MATDVKRIFKGGDSRMIETADVIHGMFMKDISVFTAFDGNLDAAFGAALLGKIDYATDQTSDSQARGTQGVLTDDVLKTMELCRNKYNEVRYFSIQAFRGKKGVLNEFGKKDYPLCRASATKMGSFMDELFHTCLKYETELNAVGLTTPRITEVETLGNQLKTANTTQENYKRNRVVLTEKRITALNECYTMAMVVVRAAKVIFANDYARYNKFLFAPGIKKKMQDKEE